jgi:hypothetical protein
MQINARQHSIKPPSADWPLACCNRPSAMSAARLAYTALVKNWKPE